MSNFVYARQQSFYTEKTAVAKEQGECWGLIHADQSMIIVVAIWQPALGDDIRSRRIKRTRTNECMSGKTLQLANA